MRKIFCSLLVSAVIMLGGEAAFAAESNPLLDTVKPLYGTPYKSAGTSKHGFDCSGFTSYVFNSLGVELPHSSAAQYEMGKAVKKKELKPGDLVFFNTNGRGVSHVGIYIGKNYFVHSESGRGVVKTSLNEPYYWSKRYVGAKRLPIPAMEEDQPKEQPEQPEQSVQPEQPEKVEPPKIEPEAPIQKEPQN